MSTPFLLSTGLPPLLPQTSRAPGLHISSIIQDFAIGLGHFSDDPDRQLPTNLMEVGSAVEHAIAHRLMLQFPGRYYRSWNADLGYWANGLQLTRHEQLNGIWQPVSGNLDLWRVGAADDEDLIRVAGAGATAVEDVKFTRKSPDHAIDGPSWWAAWMQVAAYCYMVGAAVGGIWIVYTGSGWATKREKVSPQDYDARLWWRVWDSGELEEVWGNLMQHANDNYERIMTRQERRRA